VVSVTDSRGLYFHQYFVPDRTAYLNMLNREVSFSIGDGGPGLHARNVNTTATRHNAGVAPSADPRRNGFLPPLLWLESASV
jgi:hypothetical protein